MNSNMEDKDVPKNEKSDLPLSDKDQDDMTSKLENLMKPFV